MIGTPNRVRFDAISKTKVKMKKTRLGTIKQVEFQKSKNARRLWELEQIGDEI